jgi:hypothetical protein
MDPTAELLQLYCDHSTQEIDEGGGLLLRHFRVSNWNELLAINGYKEAFSLVSACAALIDGLATRYPDPDAQARESIRLIRRMIDDGDLDTKIEVAKKLVEGRLYKAWPQPQKALYDQKKVILEWRDFFVSYTNRDAPAINEQFRSLIRSCLGQTPKGNQGQSNYLARVITRHLRRYQGLSGFFDEDNLKVGEDIENKVDLYCRQAFALVQLIEPLALEREPPRNWCFHEYSQFSLNPDIVGPVADKNRHFFVLAGSKLEDLQPANLAPAYRPWLDRISQLKYISLQNERNTTLRARIKEIASQIVALRAEIVNAWIDA